MCEFNFVSMGKYQDYFECHCWKKEEILGSKLQDGSFPRAKLFIAFSCNH